MRTFARSKVLRRWFAEGIHRLWACVFSLCDRCVDDKDKSVAFALGTCMIMLAGMNSSYLYFLLRLLLNQQHYTVVTASPPYCARAISGIVCLLVSSWTQLSRRPLWTDVESVPNKSVRLRWTVFGSWPSSCIQRSALSTAYPVQGIIG